MLVDADSAEQALTYEEKGYPADEAPDLWGYGNRIGVPGHGVKDLVHCRSIQRTDSTDVRESGSRGKVEQRVRVALVISVGDS
jgi:hypothetical protein